MIQQETDQGTIADMHDNWVEIQKKKLRWQTYAIFRQERFVGWCDGPTAMDALDLWVTTPRSDGTDLRKMVGPWSAVEASEALERKMISEGIYRQAIR